METASGCPLAIETGTVEYKIMMAFLLQTTELKPSAIAQQLQIPHQTINSALKRLSDQGFIAWEKYKNIELTENGKAILQHIETHLHLIEIYLMNTLDLSSDDARKEAIQLAPHFSCTTISRICSKYAHPDRCPNHAKIPYSASCHSHTDHVHE